MKVWYLSAYDQPRGQSTRTFEFSKELVSRGHQVTFFTNSYCHFTHKEYLQKTEKVRSEIIDGIRILWLKTPHYRGNGIGRTINMFANIKQIWFASQCMETKPDVIIAPSVPITTGWIGYCLSIKYKVPFIYEVRDVWPDALVDIGGLSRRNPAYHIFRLMEKRLYKNAVYVSSTLPFLQDHVKASGADPNKVRYIPNGFDYSLFSKFSQLTNENKSDKNDIVVMYIGGYGLLHDVSTIIKAAQIIQQSGDLRFRFVLIGGGTKKEECVNEAKSYNLNNVEFRDPIPKDQIQEAQNNADILIAATINSKCFRFGLNQNKLIGYLASGRPVIICTNAPENPVTKSGCGFHVDAENPLALVDALKRVAIMSIEERKKLGIRGRSYVENNLSIQKLGSTMEKMLLSAVDEYCQS